MLRFITFSLKKLGKFICQFVLPAKETNTPLPSKKCFEQTQFLLNKKLSNLLTQELIFQQQQFIQRKKMKLLLYRYKKRKQRARLLYSFQLYQANLEKNQERECFLKKQKNRKSPSLL